MATQSTAESGGTPYNVGTGALSEVVSGLRQAVGGLGPAPRAAEPPAMTPFSVIGPDDRVQVTDTTQFPARATVYFTYQGIWCTGWMYAPNMVGTAAHCLHTGGATGAWRSGFRAYPARAGAESPFGSCDVTAAFVPAAWVRDAAAEHDYGALRLDCAVGVATGWYGLHYGPESLTGAEVTMNGYPQDKPSATQWTSRGQVVSDNGRSLAYTADSTGGQSGSPVHGSVAGAECSPHCLLAVHAYGGSDSNSGPKLTRDVFDNLLAWRDA